ncbi:MAG: LPS export ABC transporter ATP-binding protein [Planctomycetota bacterium]
MALLEACELVKVYGKRRVVDRVSFEVDTGEIVGLLGPNGAGKTTSFRMTVGMISPNEGRVLLEGQDVTRLPMFKRARRGMGYLSQERSIFRNMTVRDNLIAVLELTDLARTERNRRADDLLDELGLTDLARHRADTLSGGEQRRLEICRTLATSPRLILLDEPFVGIDPITVEEIQAILFQLVKRDIAILITDHAVRETLATTSRSYIIVDGRILRHGDPHSLAEDAEVRKAYLGESFALDPTRPRAEPRRGSGLPRAPHATRRYNAVGRIIRINAAGGSIELDHERIDGLMPATRKEWPLKDRSLLSGLRLADEVDFTIEDRHGRQVILDIKPRSR